MNPRPDGRAAGLDHVAIVAADIAAASAELAALGFRLTPLAAHADASGTPTGTGNRCAMLGAGYLEVLSVIDPARSSGTIGRMLAHHAGGHILSLAIGDAAAAAGRLARAGLPAALATTTRPTPWGEARFERLPGSDINPRLQLIRHHTPDLVWRAEDLAHPNGAEALESVLLVSEAPAVEAALLSRWSGWPMQPDPAGGYRIALPAGTMRVLPPDAMARLLPGVDLPPGPAIAGVVVRTRDAAADGRVAVAAGLAIRFAAR